MSSIRKRSFVLLLFVVLVVLLVIVPSLVHGFVFSSPSLVKAASRLDEELEALRALTTSTTTTTTVQEQVVVVEDEEEDEKTSPEEEEEDTGVDEAKNAEDLGGSRRDVDDADDEDGDEKQDEKDGGDAAAARDTAKRRAAQKTPSTKQNLRAQAREGVRAAIEKPLPPDAKVIVVGNGRSLASKSYGGLIDSYNVVARFNYFKTAGLEKQLGTKLTYWFLNDRKSPRAKNFNKTMAVTLGPNRIIVPVPLPVGPRCRQRATACNPTASARGDRRRIVTKVRKSYNGMGLSSQFLPMPIHVYEKLRKQWRFAARWPSTGIVSLVYMTDRFPKSRIDVLGFDFQNAKRSDCRSNRRRGPNEVLCKARVLGHAWEAKTKPFTQHDIAAEANMLRRLVSAGRVRILD